MKRKNMANQVLASVVLFFVITSVLKYFYRDSFGIQLFSFVMEAAVVGGVADWFAVTALFRKPLGFPWHTALITRHRERVIHAIADMIQNELLSVDSIKKRVDRICFIGLFIDWVEHKEGKLILKKMLSQYGHDTLERIDLKKVSIYIDEVLKQTIQKIDLIHHVKAMTQWAVEHKGYEQLVSAMIDQLIPIVETSNLRQLIYEQLVKIREEQTKSIFEKAIFWFAEQTDSVNLSEAADAMYEEVLIILYEAKKKDHILYEWLNTKLLEIMDQLEDKGPWEGVMEEFKQILVRNMDVTQIVEKSAQVTLEIIKDSSNSPVVVWFYKQLDIYWNHFKQNQQAQIWLEVSAKQALYKVIENEHQLIGIAVKSVLNNFSNDDLNQFIEEKAGDDLQWIRINGCVVGGVVGLVLFIFLHYVYDPFVVPIIQGMVR